MIPNHTPEAYVNGCMGKRRFHSPKLAWRNARKEKTEPNEKLRAYHCSYCGSFHLTSTMPSRKRRKDDAERTE